MILSSVILMGWRKESLAVLSKGEQQKGLGEVNLVRRSIANLKRGIHQ